jgi:hypothetical protein
MKPFHIVILSSMMLFGCSKPIIYNLSLKSVELPKTEQTITYDKDLMIEEESDSIFYHYEDGLIDIRWYPESKGFFFELLNKSEQTIKINWDEVVYIDEKGRTNRVVHNGVNYTETDDIQVPSIIPKGATLEDFVMPAENAYYVSGQYGGWKIESLFERRSTIRSFEKIRNQYKDKTVKLIIPIVQNVNVKEYTFVFVIHDVILIKKLF